MAYISFGASLMFSLMLCVHLYRQRKRNGIVRILFWAMVVYALMLLKIIPASVLGAEADLGISRFIYVLELCWVPLVVVFNFSVLFPKWTTPARVIFLFIPFALLDVINWFWRTDAIYYTTLVFAILFAATGFYFTFVATVRYNRHVKDNYSDTSHIGVTWVRGVNIIFIFWYIFTTASMLQDSWYADTAKNVADITVWTVVYHYSIYHRIIEDFPDVSHLISARPFSKMIPSSNEALEPHLSDLMTKIYACFEIEKLYLNPNLTLNDVATAASSNRSYISKAINSVTGDTFFQFVNKRRIQYAVELMNDSENKKITLEYIARISGFNSMTTFYNFFRKDRGCTPGEYLKKMNKG